MDDMNQFGVPWDKAALYVAFNYAKKLKEFLPNEKFYVINDVFHSFMSLKKDDVAQMYIDMRELHK